MERTSLVAGQPLAECGCRVETDVDVHVTERASLDLEHAMCGEITQSPAQAAEGFAEGCGHQVDRDVALGLHAEQRCQPARPHRVTGKTPERMTAHQYPADRDVFRILVPIALRLEAGGDRVHQRAVLEARRADAERSEAIARVRTRRVKRRGRRGTQRDQDLTGVPVAVEDLFSPVPVHRVIEMGMRAISDRFVRCVEEPDADEQLHRGLQRVAEPRERRRCSRLARGIQRIDVQLAGREHRGNPPGVLAMVSADLDLRRESRCRRWPPAPDAESGH